MCWQPCRQHTTPSSWRRRGGPCRRPRRWQHRRRRQLPQQRLRALRQPLASRHALAATCSATTRRPAPGSEFQCLIPGHRAPHIGVIEPIRTHVCIRHTLFRSTAQTSMVCVLCVVLAIKSFARTSFMLERPDGTQCSRTQKKQRASLKTV